MNTTMTATRPGRQQQHPPSPALTTRAPARRVGRVDRLALRLGVALVAGTVFYLGSDHSPALTLGVVLVVGTVLWVFGGGAWTRTRAKMARMGLLDSDATTAAPATDTERVTGAPPAVEESEGRSNAEPPDDDTGPAR